MSSNAKLTGLAPEGEKVLEEAAVCIRELKN